MDKLEPDEETTRSLLDQTSAWSASYLARIWQEPSFREESPLQVQPLSEAPRPFLEVLKEWEDLVLGASVNSAGGTYQAYIPGGGLLASALGELLACVTNRYTGVYGLAPGPVSLEVSVLRWLGQLVGYPEEARGILTSGGSLANFSALVTARRALLPEDFLQGTLYVSDQVHHSVQKAAMLAGFPASRVRSVGVDGRLRLDPEDLRRCLARDRAEGLQPFLIVASAGTTNTGAVDPLVGLADLAREEGLWLHVDAAYGGFFLLTERGRQLLEGIERADSVTLDPHKGLFLPYGTGCLLVRSGKLLRQAHEVQAEYLQDLPYAQEQINFSDYSPELTRPFRGLALWMPLQLHGVRAFREALDEKLDLARQAAEALKAMPGVVLVDEPQLSVVAFRVPQMERVLEKVNATRRTFLSSTRIQGQKVLRLAILSLRTHRAEVEATLGALREALRGE